MNSQRTATYTSPAADEIHLRYIQEGGKEEGKKAHAFYSPEEYAHRQRQHGISIYPHPTHAA